MNKKEFLEELQTKTNFDDNTCNIINDIIENHFIIGKKNKEKIISELSEKLKIDENKADNIYNTAMEIISGEIKNTLKNPFKSK